MKLPTRQEINVHDSLDERCACEHFLGKTLEEAEVLFCENSLRYQEDLMFMGPVAFRYYVQAVINYIQSPAATGDDCMIECLASLLEFRLEYERAEVLPISQFLIDACRYVIANSRRFIDADLDLYIHLDFRSRYEALIQRLTEK